MRKEHTPHFWDQPHDGSTQIFSKADHTSRKLTPLRNLIFQQIIEKLLLYAKAIDLTILISLGTISAAQTSGTIKTEKAILYLLDYCAVHPDATLQYKASGIILKAYIGASYFS